MKMDRRRFLLAALAGAATAAKNASAQTLIDRGFAKVIRIADGVYATLADEAKGPQCLSNGGVIVGRDAVLIVEGHFQPAGAAFEIEVAQTFTRAPIRAAVDTHFHLDHTFGNLGYAEQRIPIIAHERVTSLMKEQYAASKGQKARLLAPFEQKVAAAVGAADTARATSDLDAIKWMYESIDAATLAFPTELLSPGDLPKRIDLGGLTALIEFHAGHTPADLIVRVPERDVVFAGDLLFNGSYPVAVDADMVAWRRVLDRFAAYDRRTQFVPGHHAVCGRGVVREQAALFDDLYAHAERMMRAGATAEEAERRYIVPKRFQNHEIGPSWFTIGAAMRSYFARRASPRPAALQLV